MQQDKIAVSIQHLTKIYKVFDTPGKRLAYHLFKTKSGTDFKALDDVSFDIKKGEAFAIIGKNGSGKSTLLQILAGIIKETSGNVQIDGKIAALLELGSGFDPESTGYENIYMNAAILGVNKKKIEEKIKDIIEFADIGEHIHQPVKTYSSGMYVRLGFAIAINVDANILLVDEALAVGDVFFRQKCYERLNQLKKKGTTIILVTHNMSEVEQFCDRAVLLHYGEQKSIGTSQSIVKEYYLLNQKGYEAEAINHIDNKEIGEQEVLCENVDVEFEGKWKCNENIYYNLEDSSEISNGMAKYLKIGLFDKDGKVKRVFQQGEYGYFYMEVEVFDDIKVPIFGTALYNQMNTIVHGKSNLQTYTKVPYRINSGTKLCALQKIKFDIAEGEYSFEAGFSTIDKNTFSERKKLRQEEINKMVTILCVRNKAGVFSIITKKTGNPTKMAFDGNSDLMGNIEIVAIGKEE